MQQHSAAPIRQQTIPLREFLSTLFQALEREGLRPCILRNYEGFPDTNAGNDIDLFIHPSELPRAMRALGSLAGIRIVGFTERQYVANVFLEGSSAAPGIRMQHVDFNLRLTWKGLPYLSTAAVLQAAIPRSAGNLKFLVPRPVHEAVISLFASLLVGGWLKEKYFPEVQRTFARDRSEVIDALSMQFGLKAATRLVESVIAGDRRKILGCIGSLRASLALRSLLRRPVRSVFAIARHYWNEFAIRFSPQTLETVCLLGPDGCGKAAIVESLTPMLQSAAVVVEKHRYTPRLLFKRRSRGGSASADSSASARAGSLTSMASVVLWLVEDWANNFIERKNLTLRIRENSCEDLVIDPEKYNYGGPMWFARLVGKFFPTPDLWMMLDPVRQGMQSGDGYDATARNQRQIEAYSAFAKTRKRYVILDTVKQADRVMENAYTAVVETLVLRAGKKLKKRFQI
jgi:hypothetical protein